MANGMVTEYNMWGIIGNGLQSDVKVAHHGASRRARRKKIKKNECSPSWFTTIVDEHDEDIIKVGMPGAIRRYAKGDLEEGLIDYSFWKRYAGLSEEACRRINRELINLVLSGKYLDKNYTVRRLAEVGGISNERAELIAITELSNLSNLVRSIAYSRRTKVEKFKWVTENDSKVCEKCRELERVTASGVSLEEMKRLIKMIGSETAREFILHPRCYTEGHLLWTCDGWKSWDEVKIGEKVWSMNPETLNLEMATVISKVKYWYSGDVYNFSGLGLRLIVTPDHEMWVYNGLKLVPVYPEDVAGGIPRIPMWDGVNINNISIGDVELFTEDYIRFMAWYLAEGGCYNGSVRVYQSDDEKRELIYELCERMFSEYGKVMMRKNYVSVNGLPELSRYLCGFGKSVERYVPDVLKIMDRKSLRLFLDEYVEADGHRRVKNGYVEREIYTSSRKMLRDLTEIAFKAGYNVTYGVKHESGKKFNINGREFSNGYDCYYLRLKLRQYSNAHVSVEKYSGYVYDVELDKNHVLCVSYGGKTVWSGNCRCTLMRANEDKRYMRWWE